MPRELREFRSSLPLRSWFRIITVSAGLAGLLAWVANALIPGIGFDWFAAFVIGVGAVVVILAVCLILLMTVPPLVFVTQNGFGWWWPLLLDYGFVYFKRSELKSVTLTVRDDGRHYLRFRTERFCKRVGVARRVNLESFLDMFGNLLVVRDRRRRGGTNG